MSEATTTAYLAQQSQTKRQRAFLGPLPDDFLCVDPPSTALAYPQPAHGQHPTQGHHRDTRLVPMTYGPQDVPPPRVDNNILGKLKITIAQAQLTKNYGFTRMDPYCRVRIGHSVYETPTDVNGSKNPRWNKVFSCNLPRGINSLYIEVFNERYLALDDRVAWAYFELPEDLFSGESVEEWVSLSGKQGEGQEGNINIILSFQEGKKSTMADLYSSTKKRLFQALLQFLEAHLLRKAGQTPMLTGKHSDPFTLENGAAPCMDFFAQAPPSSSYQLTAYGNQPVTMVPSTMPGVQMYYKDGYVPGYPQQVLSPQSSSAQPPHQTLLASQQPRVKEEDVKQLVEMFPTLEKDVIHSVLEASNGNTDTAVTSLLQMTAV